VPRDHYSTKLTDFLLYKYDENVFPLIPSNNNGTPGLSAHSIRSYISTGGAVILESLNRKFSITVISRFCSRKTKSS